MDTRNLQGCHKKTVQDLPSGLIVIRTKEYLTLLNLIDEKKQVKATELLFLDIYSNLLAVNDYNYRTTGQKFSEKEKKELCALIKPLEDLGRSELLASIPDTTLAPSFRSEVNDLKKSCVERQNKSTQ